MNKNISKQRARIAVGCFFFLQGLSFASWAARIPAIQEKLHLTEAETGTALFALPIASTLSMPFVAWLVAKHGSARILLGGIFVNAFMLLGLGMANSLFQLALCLFIYGFSGNSINVSLNTQAVSVENHYQKSIMASFHGLWSLAGFVGASIASVFIANHIQPLPHFIVIFSFACFVLMLNRSATLPDIKHERPNQKKNIFPRGYLLGLGCIAFCSMACEGAMFDWGGIYFKKVVAVEPAWVNAGYTAFMSTMATARFFADRLLQRFGFTRMVQASGILTTAGYLLAICFPSFYPALLGFFMVGAGVSAVVPLVFSEAGKSKQMSSSAAIAAVSTLGFLGFLLGPPMIGWVAELSSLRVSFAIITLAGVIMIFLPNQLRNLTKS